MLPLRTAATLCLLSLWLVSSPAAAQSDDLEDTTKDPARWKMSSGSDILLLVRKVDEEHPYFKSLMFRRPTNPSEILLSLTGQIARHCNISNITMLVKNDLLMLRTTVDASGLTSGDRIEAWTVTSGLATRGKTSMTFAKYVRNGILRPPMAPLPSVGGGSGGHHGGGRGKGGGKYRRAAVDLKRLINSFELDGF